METPKELQKTMTRYLLGEATPVEQEDLEERYASDPELFEQLVAIENDLADRYARHELSPAEQVAFERHVLQHPRRRARVEVAKTLIATLEKTDTTDSSLSIRERAANWLSSINFSWRLTAGVAAATALLIAGTWWRLSLSQPSNTIKVAQNAGTPKSPTPVSTPPMQASPTPAPSVSPEASIKTSPVFVTLVLNAGLVRGSENAQTPTLAIPPGTDEVRLRLNSDVKGYARYRLSLLNAEGKTLHSIATSSRSGSFLLHLPAASLSEGEYFLALSGIPSNGEADALSKTSFRVVKK